MAVCRPRCSSPLPPLSPPSLLLPPSPPERTQGAAPPLSSSSGLLGGSGGGLAAGELVGFRGLVQSRARLPRSESGTFVGEPPSAEGGDGDRSFLPHPPSLPLLPAAEAAAAPVPARSRRSGSSFVPYRRRQRSGLSFFDMAEGAVSALEVGPLLGDPLGEVVVGWGGDSGSLGRGSGLAGRFRAGGLPSQLQLSKCVEDQPLETPSMSREMLPARPHTQLKTIEISRFYFNTWQIEIAVYLLKNATELELMRIEKGKKPSWSVSDERRAWRFLAKTQQVPN